jgi:HD-GYP domain-containing protein (c-di-GMP phosphodiesterase class II)
MQATAAELDRRYPSPLQANPPVVHPFDRLRAIADRYVEVIEGWSCAPEDVIRLSTMATDLIGLTDAAPQVCFGMASRVAVSSPAMRHAFNVAVVAIQLGRGVGLAIPRLLAVAKTALFMNITAFHVQDDLATPWANPTLGQRITMSRHPQLAAQLLATTPGADLRWIEAVEQHHESMDGSGYPHALMGDEICLEARIVKIAELWCSLVTPRPHRAAKSPQEAMHWLVSRSRQRLDPALLEALRRLTGNYPPGTLVRLANREIALVTTWPRANAAPRRVVALFSAHNVLLRDPALRETGKSAYAVRGYSFLPQAEVRSTHWNRVWAIDCRAD